MKTKEVVILKYFSSIDTFDFIVASLVGRQIGVGVMTDANREPRPEIHRYLKPSFRLRNLD